MKKLFLSLLLCSPLFAQEQSTPPADTNTPEADDSCGCCVSVKSVVVDIGRDVAHGTVKGIHLLGGGVAFAGHETGRGLKVIGKGLKRVFIGC